MEGVFGEKGSDTWNKSMDSISKGADIVSSYNPNIDKDVLKNEIGALAEAGFSEVLKLVQTCNTVHKEIERRQNIEREDLFYGNISNDADLDNPSIRCAQAGASNRKIMSKPNWRTDPELRKQVADNDAIIRLYSAN